MNCIFGLERLSPYFVMNAVSINFMNFFEYINRWKMLARHTFSTIFVKTQHPHKFMAKVEKVGLANICHDFGPPKRLELWKMLARPTFSFFPRCF